MTLKVDVWKHCYYYVIVLLTIINFLHKFLCLCTLKKSRKQTSKLENGFSREYEPICEKWDTFQLVC